MGSGIRPKREGFSPIPTDHRQRPANVSSRAAVCFARALRPQARESASYSPRGRSPIVNWIRFIEQDWQEFAWSAGILIAAIASALIARALFFWLLKKLTARKGSVIGNSLVKHGQKPTHWIFPLIAVLAVLPGLPLPHTLALALEHIAGLALIGACAWLIVLFIEIVSDVISGRYRIDVADNLMARRVQTQFQMIHRIAIVLVTVVAVSIALMTFPAIKHIGMSILASAGLASLIVGLAMKGTLSNLIAGVQIAFAQPFRVEDVVVVEGEWGWIEEIGMMYVVVRIWDLRRLVLPLSYFLDHPFQNWTRVSADILGYVYIYTDYTVPVDPLREELRRICESTPLWGGKVCGVQVTDADAHTMQIRALMDARNSGDAWDLRCLVREKLIDYLQKNYPGCLPRYRGELEGGNAEGNGFRASGPPAEERAPLSHNSRP
jgi:small-conductance mechanosensitive channel